MTIAGSVPDIRTARLAPSRASVERTGKLPRPVLIYLLCVVIPIGFQAGPLAMTTLRLFLLVVIVPLMINLMMGKYGKVYLTDIFFIMHVAWIAVSFAANEPSRLVEQIGSVGAEFLGGYAVGRAYIRSREDFTALCRALVVIVLLTLPLALHETLTGRPIVIEFIRNLPFFDSVPIITYERRMGLERVQATFAHPIHYGLFCSMAFSLAFVALRGISSTSWRYLSSALVAGAGFLALSSGALLSIFLQFALITWAALFSGFRHRWWMVVGLFVLGYVVIDLLSNRTPVSVFMSYATFSPANAFYRAVIFEWGMKNVWGSPIFGIGLADWIRPGWMNSASVDNFWLVMAMRYGIPGFVLILLGYFFGIARIMRLDLGKDETLILFRRAWVFMFIGLSFTLTTVHIWTNIYSFAFFMFGAGMWLISATPESDDDAVAAEAQRRTGSGRSPAATSRSTGPEVVRRFGPARDSGAATLPRPRQVSFTRFATKPSDPSEDEQA